MPAGLQEVSVLLEPQRAVGGRLAAGDTVGVVVSLTFEDGTPATHAVLHGVLVTQVQGAPPRSTRVDRRDRRRRPPARPPPSASLMVTLAVNAAQAEAVVFGVEHGTLWLSLGAGRRRHRRHRRHHPGQHLRKGLRMSRVVLAAADEDLILRVKQAADGDVHVLPPGRLPSDPRACSSSCSTASCPTSW